VGCGRLWSKTLWRCSSGVWKFSCTRPGSFILRKQSSGRTRWHPMGSLSEENRGSTSPSAKTFSFGRASGLRSDVSRKPIGGQKPRMFPTRRLDVYLNDHLAGATGGIELCRRALRENLGTDLGAFLEVLLQEIGEDRRTLEDVASRLGTDRSPLKPAGAWALEKAARLKLNGRLRGYSPLSRLIELEALQAGVSAKRSLWQALQAAFPEDPRLRGVDLDALVQRADHQLGGIEAQRLAVASAALS
jgi:hypothetical protein